MTAVLYIFCSILLPLILTLAVELPVGCLLIKEKYRIPVLVCVNVLTNVPLNLGLAFADGTAYTVLYVAGEAAVIAVEALLLRALLSLRFSRALKVSLILNLLSFCTGVLFYVIFYQII